MPTGPVINILPGITMQQVVVGDTIQAVDFNDPRTVIDLIVGSPNALFTGAPSVQCWGYNEGGVGVNSAVIGELVLAAGLAGAFKELQDDVQAICAFQGRVPRSAPGGTGTDTDVATDVAQGDRIRAAMWNNLMLDIQDCFTGRFQPASSTQTTDSTSQRVSTWTNTVEATATFTFSSEDEINAFFNMGGRLGVSASIAGAVGDNSTEMATMLANMGDVFMAYDATVGDAGVNFGFGYYGLSVPGLEYQIWSGPAVGGVYATHAANIYATRNGSSLQIRVELADANDSNPTLDAEVNGTLSINAILDTPSASGSGFTVPGLVNAGSVMGAITGS